jgi:hypothetical protein
VSGKDDSEGGVVGEFALAEVVLHLEFDLLISGVEVASLGDSGLDLIDESDIVQALDQVLGDEAHFLR